MLNKWVLPLIIAGLLSALLIGKLDYNEAEDKKNKYPEERDYVKEVHINKAKDGKFGFNFVVVDLSDYKGNYKDNIDLETYYYEGENLDVAKQYYEQEEKRYLDLGHISDIYIKYDCSECENELNEMIKNLGRVEELEKQCNVFIEDENEEITNIKLFELIKQIYNGERFI